ncbi:protein kinase [Microbispora sp. NPDC049125]|uniref:serine/threonine-protein kinase n=1 Tax=Microbispora sp. NPDC049125 TaxID=3154929 RepID=UPI00346745AF
MDEGRRVAGRYHLLEPIGRGGMGVVWRAHDDLLDRPVAVKEVLYHPADDEDREAFNRRTIREARAAGRIDHPNVVIVHDVIEEDGRPWIVMQLVKSRSLGQVLREHGPLVPERVAAIGLQVLDALRTAHAAGVLHRDVKPENVLIGADNRVVLTDFGIAMMLEEPGLTMTGAISGTPAFIPPERLNGLPATPESDLWSLGATLYAAVEGRPPFDRNSPVATMAAVLHDEPDPPRRAGPLTPVLEGLLRKDPVMRLDATEASDLLNAALAADAHARPAPASSPSYGAPPGPYGSARQAPGREPGNGFAGGSGTWREAWPGGGPPEGPHGAGPGRGGPEEPARHRSSTRMILLVVVPVLLAALAAGGWYGYHTLVSTTASPSPTPHVSLTPETSQASSPETSPETTPTPEESASAGPTPRVKVPDGWAVHRDRLGFSVALPPGWVPYQREGARVRFHGPGTRDYLQVDLTPWEDDDPVSALTVVEAASTGKGFLPGYERLRLEATRYQEVPAADWEFTFVPSYGKVRVLDRAFRMPDGRHFTIYWQVADARWTSRLPYLDSFMTTFQPK